jgi:hypothetical protein
MGNYSELCIDRIYVSWKNQVPAFITFLFDEKDFYAIKNPDDDKFFQEIGYKTTCSKSINVLEKFGYSIGFFTQIYKFFYDDLYANLEDCVKEKLAGEIEEKVDENALREQYMAYVNSFPMLARLEELHEFVKFISEFLRTDFRKPPFDKPFKFKFKGSEYLTNSEEYLRGRSNPDLYMNDFEALGRYVLNQYVDFPPWIIMICLLFDEEGAYLIEYPEIISLMFIRLILSAVNPDSGIKLELADIIEEEKDAKELHVNNLNHLIEKVNLYNNVFKTLFVDKDEIRAQYIKTRCLELLAECDRVANKYKKGLILERLTEIIFTSNNSLELVDKRASTGDEEIDLVIKNHIHRPFWMAFSSPLFFIECKNWYSPVGTKELTNFEIKLQNHTKLVKIGFFVCLNGFTSEVESELKRVGRDEYHVVLIDRKDISEYLSLSTDFFVWLEKQVSKVY